MQLPTSSAEMSGYGTELFPSYNDVVARREWEIGLIKEKLEKGEAVDLPLCRIERVTESEPTVRFGLKRGKLLYVFKYPTHDVERDKHRNVVTRARFIKDQLEAAGYRLIPWDFKKGQPPKFWDEETTTTTTMEEEDDDLYGPTETAAPSAAKDEQAKNDENDASSGDEPMDEGLESGEEDESESDSDIEIIIDKPTVAPKPVQPAPQESKAIKIEAPPQPSASHTQAGKTALLHQTSGKQGTDYKPVRTSTIDVNADPVYPPQGKPITQVNIDSDLAESTKPWRLPGADQSDYFNYGFDEFTWEMYRVRHNDMKASLAQQKAETEQMQQMLARMGGGPGPGAAPGPAIPTGPAAGAGGAGGGGPANMPMPGGMNEEMMAQAFQQMMAQGIDPSTMDFNSFMSMASGGAMPGFGAPTGPAAAFGGGGGNQGGGSGRRGGRGRGNWQ